MPATRRLRNYLAFRPDRNLTSLGLLVAEDDTQLELYYVGKDRFLARALDFNDPAAVFIGPKGVGKSAILQMLRIERKADIGRVIDISPDDLAFSALANVTARTPLLIEAQRNQFLFKMLWDYILALEVLKREYGDRSRFGSIFTALLGDHDAKQAKRLMEISLSDDGQAETLSAKILALVNEIEVTGETEGASISGTVRLDPSSLLKDKQLQLLGLINNVSKRLPQRIDHQYYILIDDLDLHWTDSPVQNAFLGALFLSLRRLNHPPGLKFVVALRENIFKRIPFEEKDKYRDTVCRVEWDRKSVKQIVQKRVCFALNCQESEVWSHLFPANAFDLMWKCSSGMPRELIRLATLAIEDGQRNDHKQISDDDLTSAIRRYSDERLEDLGSIFRYRYPGFERVAKKFRGRQKEFPLGAINEIALQLAIDVEDKTPSGREYTWAGGFMDDPKGLARLLLECDFLLLKQNRTAHPRPYNQDEDTFIGDDAWFAVHPMYAPGLELLGAQ